jgi:soluble lytic murein transglycosylase
MKARAVVPLAMLVCACRGGSAPEVRPAAEPASASSGISSMAPADAGMADAAVVAVDEGMPRLAVVLDDPRLATAAERVRARDASGAARAVDALLVTASLEPARARAWSYVAGRLHLQAGENADAAAAFERVLGPADDAGVAGPLSPYAALHEAEALVRAGRHDEAIARARAIGDDMAAHDDVKLVLADAYSAKGDRASAVPLWRALLAASPRGVRWVDSSLRLAGALLDGADGLPQDHAHEALDLATRVAVEAPATAETADVAGLRSRAAHLLKLPAAPALTPEERARQAAAWLDGSQPKRATEVADALLQALPKTDTSHREAACKAAIVRAQAVPRSKSSVAADAWGMAIDRCDGSDDRVTAFYYGAKASASAHRDDEALERFGRVEKLFPAHRFADDARMRAALVVLDQGDAARSAAMLASVADTYPDGDMKGEALFRVALDKIVGHDFDGARAALDRVLGMPADDHASGSPGRAAYFRARVAQLSGDVVDAKTRYAALVEAHPLSYYMLLAFDRLHALDEAAARTAMDSGAAREPPGSFLTGPHAELASPAFERFQRLLEVGEVDAARHEASAGGLVGEGVDPEVLWTVAWSYNRAGAADLGHSFARGRLAGFRTHWPAGRWRLAWQVAFPRPWDDVVSSESASAGIPSPLTWSIMREESAFNADARSVANAIGLMQLLVGTGRQLAHGTPLVVDEDALHRPDVSIALGARLLASLRASFSGNPTLAIAAYNGGSAPVRRWLGERGGDDFDMFVERIPYDETRNYLKRVLTSEAAYAYLYAPETLRELLALPERAAGQEPVAPHAGSE